MYTINDLWSGSIIPCEMKTAQDSQYAELLRTVIEQEDSLFETFSEEQKKLYNSIYDHQLKMMGLEVETAFAIGFRIAVGLVLDTFKR